MDIERANRYKDKLNLIKERLGDIEEWTSDYDNLHIISDKKTRFAYIKHFRN